MNKTKQINRRTFLRQTTAAGAMLSLTPPLLSPARGDDQPASPAGGRKIKVGLIGCGSVSGSYLPNLTRQPFIEVVSVCDLIIERAQKRAERFKVPNVYPNIEAMLAGAPFELLVNTTSMPSSITILKEVPIATASQRGSRARS